MPQDSTEILKDDDLQDLFGDAPSPEASAPPVTHVPVPTPQIKIGNVAKPQIQIQIPGMGPTKVAEASIEPEAIPAKKSRTAILRKVGVLLALFADRALDVANKPFWWMSAAVRKYVGLVAVVTLAISTAAIVLGPKLFPRYDAARILDALHVKPAAAEAGESNAAS